MEWEWASHVQPPGFLSACSPALPPALSTGHTLCNRTEAFPLMTDRAPPPLPDLQAQLSSAASHDAIGGGAGPSLYSREGSSFYSWEGGADAGGRRREGRPPREGADAVATWAHDKFGSGSDSDSEYDWRSRSRSGGRSPRGGSAGRWRSPSRSPSPQGRNDGGRGRDGGGRDGVRRSRSGSAGRQAPAVRERASPTYSPVR
jgi:hypothetical protein